MSARRPRGRLIAIEGATGVGKSTLAMRIADYFSVLTDLDPYERNPLPFPDGVTPGTSSTALAAELAFLGLRIAQLRDTDAQLAAGHSVIADWAMVKTEVFTRISLPAEDADRVNAAARMWQNQLPSPDLVVYLRASPDVLLERIRARARPFESALDETVLALQSQLFDAALSTVPSPVLVVDADEFDVFDVAHVRELAARIRGTAAMSAPSQNEEEA